jgi:predicted transcriptional regulator of viral defense system
MRIECLTKIKKFYFSARDIADVFNISYESAKVTCSRYADKGLIIRLKRNFYITYNKWVNLSLKDKLSVANILQVPSYISLTTALEYYEITSQVQRNFIESVSVKKTRRFEIREEIFAFSKIQKRYFNNFIRRDGIFIAVPEKAFVDAVYLMAFNMYKLDLKAIDYAKLDKTAINKILRQYPDRVKRLWGNICKT